MLIIDSHLDLAWNALQWNRNLHLQAHTLRVLEKGQIGPGRGKSTVSFPDMQRGRIAVCCATLLARCTGTPVPDVDFATPYQTYGIAQGQLAFYRALEQTGSIRILTTGAAFASHIAAWEAWDAAHTHDLQSLQDQEFTTPPPPLGCVISMESADSIPDPIELDVWHADGVRVIGPAHYGPGRYSGGTGTDLGLTPLGYALLKAMTELKLILDLSHLSDTAFWQALDVFDGAVMASHNNCRTLVTHQRQFSDRQLQAIFERDGVIGSAFDAWMLMPGWIVGQSTNINVSIADVANHIDHICQLSGNSRHAAIGSDLDGGFGYDQSPCDLDTIADMQNLRAILTNRGYKEGEIRDVFYRNWQRLLQNHI
jgi:membrane dipeptidase